MEELRIFLDSRAPLERTKNADIVWQQLVHRFGEVNGHRSLKVDKLVDFGKLSNEDLIQKIKILKEEDTSSIEDALSACMEILRRSLENRKPPIVLLHTADLPLIDKAVSCLQYLNSRKLLPFTDFFNTLLKLPGIPSVEVLWRLHKSGLMQITTYVSYKMQQVGAEETHLPSALMWYLTHPEENRSDIVREILVAFLATIQSGPPGCSQVLASSSVGFLQSFIRQVVDWLLNQSPLPSGAKDESICLSHLELEKWSHLVGRDGVHWFVLTHLLQLLSERTDLTSVTTLGNIVRNQGTQWALEATPKSLQDVLSMVVVTLGTEEVVRHLAGAVVKSQVNWRIVLLITTMMVKTLPDAPDALKRVTEQLLRRGLEGGRQMELAAAFFLARQCCHCNCPGFESYSVWFSTNFGPDSSTARSQVQFKALIEFLTKIVPAETADTLRVHINKGPHVPTNCHSLLHDYNILAKTRLADLNESTELSGLFADSQQLTPQGMDFRKADVLRVLQHFQRTQEVIKPVLEASIFRRQYYRDVFLVELLELHGSSESTAEDSLDGCHLDESLRHEFILKLQSMGKIPEKMFKEYGEKRRKIFHTTEDKELSVQGRNRDDMDRATGLDTTSAHQANSTNVTEQPKKKKSLKVRPKKK